MTTPEESAREKIDAQLRQSGWAAQSRDEMDLPGRWGAAAWDFPLMGGNGEVDCLLSVLARPCPDSRRSLRPAGAPSKKPSCDPLPTGSESLSLVAGLMDATDPESRLLATDPGLLPPHCSCPAASRLGSYPRLRYTRTDRGGDLGEWALLSVQRAVEMATLCSGLYASPAVHFPACIWTNAKVAGSGDQEVRAL